MDAIKDMFNQENLEKVAGMMQGGGGDDGGGGAKPAPFSGPAISPPQIGARENPYDRFSSQDDLMAMYLQGSL